MHYSGSGKIKRCLKSVLSIIMAGAFFLVSTSYVFSYADKISELEDKIENIKKESESTKSEIEGDKLELINLTGTANDLKGTLNELNTELKKVSKNLELIEANIVAKDAEVKEIEASLEEAYSVERQQYEAMKKRIQFMYEKKSQALSESFFGARSFSEYLNRSNYIQSMEDYDQKLLVKYQNTCRVINDAKELINQEQDELKVYFDDAASQQDRVTDLIDRTNECIERYETEIAATEKAIMRNEEELKEQQADLATYQAQLSEEKRLSQVASTSEWRKISDVNYADSDRKLLANIIYCEAGNQSYAGKLGVGAVVMNRVMSSVFPNTIVGVIYQSGQFTPAQSGRLSLALARDEADEECYQAADAAMAGQSNVGNCLFFRTSIPGLKGIKIDSHTFY